jgi:cytochrome bd-type quinol oxidase subunit 2
MNQYSRMKLPPHTPEQVLRELGARPNIRKRIARSWMIVGGLLALFMGAMAVAHYAYGMPIQNKNTGADSTPGEALTMFLMIGGGGLLFLVMGILLHGWKSRPSNDL